MADKNLINPANSISSPGFSRNGTLITAQELRENYLWGVDLRDRRTNLDMPDTVITRHILDAVSFIEHVLNLTLTPTSYEEDHDFRAEDYGSWGFINLYHSPVISVEAFEIHFLTTVPPYITFPSDWYRIYREAGQICLAPTIGSLDSWSIAAAGIMIQPGGFINRREFPQLFKLRYTAGFENDKIPYLLNSLIAQWSAINLLAMLGNIIISPGVVGYAIGLDGSTESVQKNPDPYQVMTQVFLNAFNQELSIAKSKYSKIRMRVA
jgi:hypothetical protein